MPPGPQNSIWGVELLRAEGGKPGTPDVADEPSGGVVGLSSKHQWRRVPTWWLQWSFEPLCHTDSTLSPTWKPLICLYRPTSYLRNTINKGLYDLVLKQNSYWSYHGDLQFTTSDTMYNNNTEHQCVALRRISVYCEPGRAYYTHCIVGAKPPGTGSPTNTTYTNRHLGNTCNRWRAVSFFLSFFDFHFSPSPPFVPPLAFSLFQLSKGKSCHHI